MVKKVNNPLKIDYQNGIIENRLLQIRNFKDVNTPKLINVWSIRIDPRDSKKVIEYVYDFCFCIHGSKLTSKVG
ncbi:Tad3 [Saccharomyces cerevisiae]|nr:Tad3 [Saccharomyces cerevisiae]